MSEYLTAADGILARKSGEWARDKLAFLDRFFPAALNATQRKRDRVYLDLFAGPGLNRVEASGEEFEGSPLRALQVRGTTKDRPAFTRALLCNTVDIEHEALRARVVRLETAGRVAVTKAECRCADSNQAIAQMLEEIHPRAYVFAFADIEGVQQLPWSTIAALRARHTSVDLYVLVPVEMSFNRLLGTNAAHRARNAPVLSAYFGHERWRPIADQWLTDGVGARIRRELLEMYLAGLRTLWTTAEVVEVGTFGGDRLLYRMIFASDHDAGIRIGRYAAQKKPRPQRELEL